MHKRIQTFFERTKGNDQKVKGQQKLIGLLQFSNGNNLLSTAAIKPFEKSFMWFLVVLSWTTSSSPPQKLVQGHGKGCGLASGKGQLNLM